MILLILPNISGHAWVHAGTERMLACRTQTSGWTSDITVSGEGYDETLHSLMRIFWDMFDSGQITQTITCSICTCVTTRKEPFSELLVQFPDSHHEATLTSQKCTLNSLIKHHFKPEDLPDYECLTCGRRTLATRRVQISCYPVILCIVLGCKMNDETRITSAVDYPVIKLNLCTIFRSHEGTMELKYNLIVTVNHKPTKKNDGHYCWKKRYQLSSKSSWSWVVPWRPC